MSCQFPISMNKFYTNIYVFPVDARLSSQSRATKSPKAMLRDFSSSAQPTSKRQFTENVMKTRWKRDLSFKEISINTLFLSFDYFSNPHTHMQTHTLVWTAKLILTSALQWIEKFSTWTTCRKNKSDKASYFTIDEKHSQATFLHRYHWKQHKAQQTYKY